MNVPAVSNADPGRVTPGEHHLLLLWLLFTGVLLFALFIGWQQGLLHTLYETDRSKLSVAITLIYLVVTFHCARRITIISSEYNAARRLDSVIRDLPQSFLNDLPDTATGRRSGDGFLIDQYVTDLQKKLSVQVSRDERTGRELIEVYAEKLKGPHEIGWFAADIMLKLGLLGTIIGFIMMLGSVANVTDFDVTTMQNVLQLMSSGMGTALYTTMTGLICSMLAAAQYYMLDRSVDQILGTMQHLTEVYLVPGLLSSRV